MEGGRWEAWRRLTSYPVLWLGVYVCWLAFFAVLVFDWSWLPIGLAVVAFVVAAAIPPGLLALSQWMERHYYPEGRR
jgi:hypothetical protein